MINACSLAALTKRSIPLSLSFFTLAAGLLFAQPPAVQITSPANGAVVRPGQTLQVSVSTTGAPITLVFLIGEDPIGLVPGPASPPYQFTIAIPINTTPRRYGFRAKGIIPGSGTTKPVHVNSDGVTIAIERADLPVSLNSSMPTLTTRVGDIDCPIWTGTFADGVEVDVAQSSLVTFQSDEPAVATVDTFGRITSVAAGSATITMNYGTLSIQVPVVVTPKLAIDPPVSSVYTGASTEVHAMWAVPERTRSAKRPERNSGAGMAGLAGAGVDAD